MPLTKVYILKGHWDYEGYDIIGVYEQELDGLKAMSEIKGTKHYFHYITLEAHDICKQNTVSIVETS
jgi:hypothetical protein